MDASDIPTRPSRQHSFTVKEKLALLAIYDTLEVGQKSAFCRRVGVNPSSPARWDAARRAGLLEVTGPDQNRGVLKRRERQDYARLQRENQALRDQLQRSESAVEVLGKASELLAALAKSSQPRPVSLEREPDRPPIPATFRAAPKGASDSRP